MQSLIDLAIAAGDEIMKIYESDFTARLKADQSPVTDADLAAESVILAGLKKIAPNVNVISEEATAQGKKPVASARFFLVDPLDGTREFLNRNGEFTVNIALIEDTQPVSGVIYAPAAKRLFWGRKGIGAAQFHCGEEAQWQALAPAGPTAGPKIAVASRSHRDDKTNAWLDARGITEIVSAGSSLKFCLLAAGEAHVYPRFGRTMEWDTAAGHAILAAAGGEVFTETGEVLGYGKAERGFDNPGFIATGNATITF